MPASTKTPAKKPAVAKKPIADRKTTLGNELTKSWPSKTGREVRKGEIVKTSDGKVGEVTARFTLQKKDGRIPYVCVSAKGKKGVHVPSADVQHVKAAVEVKATAKAKASAPDIIGALEAQTAMQRATAAADAAEAVAA